MDQQEATATGCAEPTGADVRGVAALILGGGTGTRLWPLSTPGRPKQFAALVDPVRSMLRLTWDRIVGLVPPEQIFVNVVRGYEVLAQAQLPDLPAGNLVVVPGQRNTLPSLGFAAAAVEHVMPSATLIVLAADNVVGDVRSFHQALLDCVVSARAGPHLVSLGVVPTWPSTQYGYMGRGAPAPFATSASFGTGYVEKPSFEVARALAAGGRHDWNTGIFAFDLEVFFHACRLHAGAHQDVFDRFRDTVPPAGAEMEEQFARLPAVDLDRGLMERLKGWDATDREPGEPGLVLVRGTFAWDDIGSWDALARHLPSDDAGNAVFGDVAASRSTGCVLVCRAPYRLRVAGLRDMVVAVSDEGDVLLRPTTNTGPGQEKPVDGDAHRLAAEVSFASSVVGAEQVADIWPRGVTVTGHLVEVRAESPPLGAALPALAPRSPTDLRASLNLGQVNVEEDHLASSECVADQLVRDLRELLDEKQHPVVVLSAGLTPVLVYALLRTRHRAAVPWKRLRMVQMDEYCGLDEAGKGVFRAFLQASVVGPLGLRASLLDGAETPLELAGHEHRIRSMGGIDLVLHGIGTNGHLGFNEPGTAFRSAARRVRLADSSRPTVMVPGGIPVDGVTLGLGLLTAARRVRVMATGSAKRRAVRDALLGPLTTDCPASSLQGHPDVRWFLDRQAAERDVAALQSPAAQVAYAASAEAARG